MGVNKQRVSKLADRIGARKLVAALAPEWIKRRVPEDDEGAKRDQKLDRIDWSTSRAVASGQGRSTCWTGKEETAEEIVDKLSSLRAISRVPPSPGRCIGARTCMKGHTWMRHRLLFSIRHRAFIRAALSGATPFSKT